MARRTTAVMGVGRGNCGPGVAGVGTAAIVDEPDACVQVRVEDGEIVMQTLDSHIPPLYHSDYVWRTMRRGIVAPPWWLILSDDAAEQHPDLVAWSHRVYLVTLAKDGPVR